MAKNNEEPLVCDDCNLTICTTECLIDVNLNSMVDSINATALEHRVVRSIKTIIDESENSKYSPARCQMLLSEVLKILSGKDYAKVVKKISGNNKFITKILPVKKKRKKK